MRIMVGLTRATSGTATVCGRRFADLPNPGLEVGVLLDASAQHAGRTGREILTIAQRTMGCRRARVDEMLDLVSLTGEEADRRVRNYSLGMRQRLGIATALLGEPEVLILDEPANGLDPAGIRWMRDLLRDYADRGGTVLLSSHLLHEIEVIADDLVVIGNGRIVAAGHQDRAARRPPAPSSAPPTSTDLGRRPRRRRRHAAHAAATAPCAPTPTPTWSARSPSRPASPCTELRAADGAGLEEMFLELTADTHDEKEQRHDRHRRARQNVQHRTRRTPQRRRADPAVAGRRRSSCARCSTPGRASG